MKIHTLAGYIQHIYLVEDSNGLLLLDGCSRADVDKVCQFITQTLGRPLSDLKLIVVTHMHPDHAGGNKTIVEATGATITAPQEVEKLSPIDRIVGNGDSVSLGDWTARVIDVSGHTNGHIAFYLAEADMAFVGDSVFALGCGRMFEGEPEQFWNSLDRIRQLPDNTMLYCAHEYTQANAKFALHADPDNTELKLYANRIDEKRAKGEPTVPTILSRELETNPFLRADKAYMRDRWGGNSPSETFAALRAAKDNF